MPKTQPKSRLEKINAENMEINLEDIKTKENKPAVTFMRSKVKETTPTEKIRTFLDEMKTKDGVVGYILRNTKSATIDLNDPTKLIDYALLSSSAKETGKELSQTFGLGEIEDVVVEGKNVKLLSLTIGENDISVFMDKNVDHTKICKTLCNIA
jgi:predicted regulator of Ras-like GTPase activity (Roadblock/LC7/MglB family)